MRCPFRFGCHASELRSGLSGWMHGTAEVLELLTFWKRGTAGGSPFSNLASSFKTFHNLFFIFIAGRVRHKMEEKILGQEDCKKIVSKNQ